MRVDYYLFTRAKLGRSAINQNINKINNTFFILVGTPVPTICYNSKILYNSNYKKQHLTTGRVCDIINR